MPDKAHTHAYGTTVIPGPNIKPIGPDLISGPHVAGFAGPRAVEQPTLVAALPIEDAIRKGLAEVVNSLAALISARVTGEVLTALSPYLRDLTASHDAEVKKNNEQQQLMTELVYVLDGMRDSFAQSITVRARLGQAGDSITIEFKHIASDVVLGTWRVIASPIPLEPYIVIRGDGRHVSMSITKLVKHVRERCKTYHEINELRDDVDVASELTETVQLANAQATVSRIEAADRQCEG